MVEYQGLCIFLYLYRKEDEGQVAVGPMTLVLHSLLAMGMCLRCEGPAKGPGLLGDMVHLHVLA